MGSVAKALALPTDTEVFHIKRLQYANDEPIVLQEVYLEAGRFYDIRNHDLRQEALTEVIQKVGKVSVVGSSVAISAQEANWEESRILDIQAGMSLLTIEEIDYAANEQPVRYSRNKLRSDRFRVVASTLNEYKISLEYRLQPGTVVIAVL